MRDGRHPRMAICSILVAMNRIAGLLCEAQTLLFNDVS